MTYYIKSGSLYLLKDEEPGNRIVTLKAPAFTTQKRLEAGDKEYYTDIRLRKTAGNLNGREYVLYDKSRNRIATANPIAQPVQAPKIPGLPDTQTLQFNYAAVEIKGKPYELYMLNSQNYRLTRQGSAIAVEMIQNGCNGGWTVNMENEAEFEPEIILGIFFFCRYLEKENEYFINQTFEG